MSTKRSLGVWYSLGAGFCAAMASVFGKLAMNAEAAHILAAHYLSEEIAEKIGLTVRVICFGCIFLSNAIMFNLFAKAMDLLGTVQALVINTATNFFTSAVLGLLLFSEPLGWRWWLGSTFILLGVYLMNIGTQKAEKEKELEKNKKRE
jgi:drug/metabolite transporter (DMT)-like permease